MKKDLVENLINEFEKLPSIGRKTAQRLAYYILSESKENALNLAQAIIDAKTGISFCERCFNYAENELCPICASEFRDKSVICVVESPKDIGIIEETKDYNGLYHVLHGVISPLKGISPEDLKIKELLSRIDENVKEVIIALDFSIEADATTLYISKLLKPLGIKVSRIASGIPAGASLEFADKLTLSQALKMRVAI